MYFQIILSAVILLIIIFVVVSKIIFDSIFKRAKNEQKQLSKIIENLKANGVKDAENLIEKSEKIFDGVRYKKTTVYAYDEEILYAKLYTPEQGDAEKTVLLAHGADGSPEVDFGQVFELYRSLGFNILLIHQRAYGSSGGKYKTYGIAESNDILMWCQWLEMRFGTGCPIIIHGAGQGAFAAMYAVSSLSIPANVKKIISEGLYESVDKSVRASAKNKVEFLAGPMMSCIKIFYKNKTGFDVRSANILKSAKKIKIPVLFIHSQKDSVTDIETVKNIAEKISGETTIISTENSYYLKDDSVIDAVKKFICE